MKSIQPHDSLLLALALLAGFSGTASANLSSSWTGSQIIPDNDLSGVAFTFTLNDPAPLIKGIYVDLDLTGGYNGDTYAYLTHGSKTAVLLNRPGRTAASPYGYPDAGFAITLNDLAGTTDIHSYGGGVPHGTYQSDGRYTDPLMVLDTDPRSNRLGVFNGMDPNGSWILYFADVSPGGISTLTHWSVTVSAVPEPSAVVLTGLAGLFLGILGRCRVVRPCKPAFPQPG